MTAAERIRVGDVLRLERRQVQVDPEAQYEEIGLRSFGRGTFHKEPVDGVTLGDKRVFQIESGDLLISNVFGWEGAIAVASDADAGKIGSHRFMTFVPRNGRVDTSWAAWYFRSESGLELIRRASPGSAGRNRTLAVKRFEDLVISVPPIEEQAQQAAYLADVSGEARATLAALTARGPASVVTMLPPLVDEIVGRPSTGCAAVADLVDLVSDIVHPGDSLGQAETFVGLQHVERHTGRRFGADAVDGIEGRKFRFRPGDVIYGYLRPYLNKIWVADRHGLCSVDQYVLRPRASTDADILAHILRGQAMLDQAIELTHSLQLPRLRSGLLMSLQVPVIPGPEANQVAEKLNRVRDLVVDIAAARQDQVRTVGALTPAALNRVFGSR